MISLEINENHFSIDMNSEEWEDMALVNELKQDLNFLIKQIKKESLTRKQFLQRLESIFFEIRSNPRDIFSQTLKILNYILL